jgi:hypothetical protein
MDPARHDGSLPSWDDIKKLHPWNALFLGNGLSMNVWPEFGYRSLFEQATMGLTAGLSAKDRKLFAAHDTTNFEVVLAALDTSIKTLGALNYKTDFLSKSYESVRRALGEAVRDVHPKLSDVPDNTRQTIQREMRRQRIVFTTSYDLILYWAMGFGEDEGRAYRGLVDLFWGGGRCEFDPADTEVWRGTPVYFLHGGMHLRVQGSGITRKLTRDLWSVLDQFGMPDKNDPQARPLLITEGSAADKLSAIDSNTYLAHAIRELRRCRRPLVIFGSSLSAQDSHLVDALNEQPDRPVAVSLRRDHGKTLRRKQQALIASQLATNDVYFYDAATHPLGSEDLSAATDLESEAA